MPLLLPLEQTQQLMDKKMEVFSKVQFTGGAGGISQAPKSGLSYKEINEKLAEIQKQLFDPDIDERESETLNIEYEKLITEFEGTDEYKKEQEEAREKWKKDYEGPNKGDTELGLRVLSNLAELELENPQFLRLMALKLEDQIQNTITETSSRERTNDNFCILEIDILRKVLKMRPICSSGSVCFDGLE